jgi:hypothetical protein
MDIPVETLRAFQATRMGWLEPAGALHAVELHQHLRFFEGHPDLGEAYRTYERTCDENHIFMDAELASLGPDDHPEMHRFDGLNDDARDALLGSAYVAGWIRLGMYIDDYQGGRTVAERRRAALEPSNWILEAEGTGYRIEAHTAVLRDLAAVLDASLCLRIVSYDVMPKGSPYRNGDQKVLVLQSTKYERVGG